MEGTLRILGISGSIRTGSYNRAALRAARDLAPEGMDIEVFDLAPLPMYNGDLDGPATPAVVQDFQARIRSADGLLVVTPEYLHSIPGVLKNALDWGSRGGDNSPLLGKPIAMMGFVTGGSGSRWGQYHLRHICHATNMLPLNRPEIYVTDVREKFDEAGTLTHEPTRQAIRELLSAFGLWIDRLR